jgi:hypothetical protein
VPVLPASLACTLLLDDLTGQNASENQQGRIPFPDTNNDAKVLTSLSVFTWNPSSPINNFFQLQALDRAQLNGF